MRIAFTYNLKLNDSIEDAEFDTPETVNFIAETIRQLGHEVEKVEVSGPISQTIARLESVNPDLIFNTAEGKLGRYREAFYPAVFEQLGIPFAGPNAYTCAVTLDKNLSKMLVETKGVKTPRSFFISRKEDIKQTDIIFPVIIKPNYEGSSKGVTLDSIVERPEDFENKALSLLEQFPSGLLVEQFIVGKDVTVPFLEGLKNGVLTPAEYVFDESYFKNKNFQIYDYDLKNEYDNLVQLKVPANVDKKCLDELVRQSKVVVETLGICDFGRVDFRVTPDGEVYFIEVNALPSFQEGSSLYASSALEGIKDSSSFFSHILKHTCKRQGIDYKSSKKRKNLVIGFAFNQKRIKPTVDPGTDIEAEYDSPETLNHIRETIKSYGHEVVDLEATGKLVEKLSHTEVDIVFNISEGIKGRYRESQVPAILDLLDIPYTGSDPSCMGITLDKGLAKRVVQEAGVPTADFVVLNSLRDKPPTHLRFPLVVKPIAEGSSKGVLEKSVVLDAEQLKNISKEFLEKYRQPVLIEEFLPGREFTVALLGEKRPRVLPPMEILFLNKDKKYPIYSYEHKLDQNNEVKYEAPAKLDKKLKEEIEKVAKKCFKALGCRDVARIDLRLDQNGQVNFIECNPLPGLTPGWSDICLIAESAGIEYRTLIGEILAPAIKRLKQKKRLEMMENHS